MARAAWLGAPVCAICRPLRIHALHAGATRATSATTSREEDDGNAPRSGLLGCCSALRSEPARASRAAALGTDRRRAGDGARRRRRRQGAADLGRPCLAGADLVRPGRDLGHHHAVHDAVRAARRDGEADAGQADGAEPRRVLVEASKDGLHLRFRACATASTFTTAIRSPPRTSSSRSSAIAAPRTT